MDLQSILKGSARMMGLLYLTSEQWFKGDTDADADKIESLIQARLSARSARDFAKADQLRDELVGMGLILEDSPQGTQWRRK
jgi:cysteinyl-tRNA synthetase